MSVSTRILSVVMMGVLLLGGASVYAQGSMAPSGQFGIGVSTVGAGVGYAVNPSLQIGFQLELQSQSRDGVSATSYVMGPSVRFLLEGIVNPYFNAGILLGKVPGSDATFTQIAAGFGLAGYISRNFGASGGFSFLNLAVSPSPTTTTFGIFGPVVGIEYWFNR